jgi:predicted transcriptional regulator
MKELTKAEEQVMQILWDIKKGFVKEILAEMPEPKPAYNTVSTIVRILEKKGFVDYTAFGKSHQYYPVITQDAYSREYLDNFVGNYFGGSFSKLVSFFAKEKNLSTSDMDELMKHVKDDIDNKRGRNDS